MDPKCVSGSGDPYAFGLGLAGRERGVNVQGGHGLVHDVEF